MPGLDLRHVAEQDLPVQAGPLDRHRLDALERVHDLVGDLDLHLVADAGLGVGPVVGDHEAAGGSGRDDRAGDVRGGHAAEASALAVHLDADRRVVERLAVLEVAERGDLAQLRCGVSRRRPGRRRGSAR